MKFFRLVSGLMTIGMIMSFDAAIVAANPLRTVCIEYHHTIGPNAGESGIVPLKFVRISKNIYSVIFSGEDNLVQGTAELKGNKMSFSMTDSGWFGSDSVYVMMSHAELNMDTKQGTFRGIDFDAWPGGGESGEYFAGTLAIVQCP
jgi:isopentenyl phosphate kinase